jgi:hypothetical protein
MSRIFKFAAVIATGLVFVWIFEPAIQFSRSIDVNTMTEADYTLYDRFATAYNVKRNRNNDKTFMLEIYHSSLVGLHPLFDCPLWFQHTMRYLVFLRIVTNDHFFTVRFYIHNKGKTITRNVRLCI